MNLFQIVFFDVVLLVFPILVYLIYLSTDKNITEKSKKIYLRLALVTSFFMVYSYGFEDLKFISILVLSSLVIFSYLEDLYILSNTFLITIMIIYRITFNNILFILLGHVLISILYLIKKQKRIKNITFIELSILINSIVCFIWIYLYNYEYFDIEFLISIIICYFFIINIICLMYEIAKHILETHMNYKELQKEKQIRLSLFKITHEIKNPIAVCKCYLDMINTNDPNQVRRYIPIIKSEIERLLMLLQDFLLINKNNLDLDIMDFNMVIEDTIEKLKPLLKENNIMLNTNIIDEEIFINGDYNRLSQVLMNVIKNSVEAMEEKESGIISISTKIIGHLYYIEVTDNGIGMDKDTLSKMKNPFFTTKKRGSGLGVSLIYEIVEAHSGKVEYLSEYGNGTKVILKLPIYE